MVRHRERHLYRHRVGLTAMDITLTLTAAEEAALRSRYPSALTLDVAVHSVLFAIVEKDSERRLQALATQYRALPSALQVEATNLLKQWLASKGPITPDIVPGDPVLI